MQEKYKILMEKLNKLYKKASIKKHINFSFGNLLDEILLIVKDRAPFLKVAIFSYQSTYAEIGEKLVQRLTLEENIPVSIVVPDKKVCSASEFSKFFNIGDDVRMVITLDRDLFDLCKYFSYVRNVPCVLGVRESRLLGILNLNILIENDNQLDVVGVSSEIFVAIDKALVLSPDFSSNIYSQCITGLIPLIEARINAFMINRVLDKFCVNKIRQAINSAFKVMQNPLKEQPICLLESILTLEFANVLTGGNLYLNCTLFPISYFCNNKQSSYDLLQITKRLLALYLEFFNNIKFRLPYLPDYNERAKALCKIKGVDDGYFLRLFIAQKNKKKDNISRGDAKTMARSLNSLLSSMKIVDSTFSALGGKDLSQIDVNLAIKYCGDIIENTISGVLLRESGFLEII